MKSRLFPPSNGAVEPRRIVITGAGIVTGLGIGWEANAKGFRQGTASFRPVSLFDVTGQRAKVASEVHLPDLFPAGSLSPKQTARVSRAGQMLLLAAREAWEQCGWEPQGCLPAVMGTTSGGMEAGEAYYRQCVTTPMMHHRQRTRIVQYQAQQQVLDMMHSLGCTGPVTVIANACASGANAIGHAWEMVRSGLADRVLTGGFDALCHLVFAGFDSLQALSTTVCRPFDINRDGLALGEGAAVLALETYESAHARGAGILGELLGYGAATDIHHLTQPHPEGIAALASMTEACDVARIRPHEVDYVNAHGTGTQRNDSSEAEAINRWAGEHAARLQVSSTKASVGHLLGAAGAVEAVVTLMALQEQWLPPTSTLESADPRARFQLVNKETDAHVDIALSNSFGFGGSNASLVLRRWT